MKGRPAELLGDLGAHYTAAGVLMDSDDPRDLEEAVKRLTSMGAPAVAERIERKLGTLQEVKPVLSTVLFTTSPTRRCAQPSWETRPGESFSTATTKSQTTS